MFFSQAGFQEGFELLPLDSVVSSATAAADIKVLIGAEEIVGSIAAMRQKDLPNALFTAAAFKVVKAGFQQAEFLGLVQSLDVLVSQSREPLLIALGLGGEQNVVFIAVIEESGNALLAIFVEFLCGAKDIRAIEFHGAGAGFGKSFFDQLGEEQILRRVLHIAIKYPTSHFRRLVVTSEKQVHEGTLEMQRPGVLLVPRAGGQMKGQGGETVLEGSVLEIGELEIILRQMEVIIDKERGEHSPGQERVALSHKVAADLDGGEWVGAWGIVCVHGKHLSLGGG